MSTRLDELDAEVESALGLALARMGGAEDQATRLRAMILGAEARLAAEVEPKALVEVAGGGGDASRAIAPVTIAVASGKGGVGKTNVAVNLAAAMAQLAGPNGERRRVTLLDADLGTANADVLCGLSPAARLDHVLTGDSGRRDGASRTLRDIVVDAPGGFRLIPGSAGISRLADMGPADRRALFDGLAAMDDDTDVLIIDTAAGVGAAVTSFVDAADVCLVVTTPEPTSVADAYALIKCASMTERGLEAWSGRGGVGGGARFQLVMNQCADAAEAKRTAARIGAVCDRFLGLRVPMLGWIAQDVRVMEAVRAREPFMVRSPGSEAARNLSLLARELAQQIGWSGAVYRERSGEAAARGGLACALRRLLHLT